MCVEQAATPSTVIPTSRAPPDEAFPYLPPMRTQSCHTSVDSTDGLLSLLAGIIDGRTDVLNLALDCISLDTEQGLTMYSAVLKVAASWGRSEGL